MIGWFAVLALAIATFAVAIFVLKLPRQSWTLFGAVLSIGLAGYAWQGVPEQASSPKQAQVDTTGSGEAMIEARKQLFDSAQLKPAYLITSDAFARQGQFDNAANLLRIGLRDNPNHLEGWLALAMALTGHADGVVTPPALYAYGRAREIDPANPGADFFLGIAYMQTGQIRNARGVWGELLLRSPEDAPWRPELEQRVEALDQMIANAPMLQQRGQ
ncbi:tetratricopeptide repeat protein [Erythrobacter sp. YT30]|uniref:tetratricopeptide repeat protein n=1 Tax=Erythrobacter sp. YT30 TaxID=1735012 RepID=UPI00076C5CF2|nr:tetratricopeptide repeat protein [Erythrobacter sp. YT30]KWV92679.1 cytochrome c biogenesis factor [Erythrobacter sp. YT30]